MVDITVAFYDAIAGLHGRYRYTYAAGLLGGPIYWLEIFDRDTESMLMFGVSPTVGR